MTPLFLTVSATIFSLVGAGSIYKAIQESNYLWLIGLLPLVFLVVFVAPYKLWKEQRERTDNLTERIKPCLQIIGKPKPQQSATGSAASEWVLVIKNSGIETAEDCHVYLEEITTECVSEKLKLFPVPIDFHWSGHMDNKSEFSIGGGVSNRLGLVCYGTDRFRSVTLALHRGGEFRLNHQLTRYEEPILLLLCITSRNTLPQYAIVRINMEALVENPLNQTTNRPICKIMYAGFVRKELSQYTRPKEEQ